MVRESFHAMKQICAWICTFQPNVKFITLMLKQLNLENFSPVIRQLKQMMRSPIIYILKMIKIWMKMKTIIKNIKKKRKMKRAFTSNQKMKNGKKIFWERQLLILLINKKEEFQNTVKSGIMVAMIALSKMVLLSIVHLEYATRTSNHFARNLLSSNLKSRRLLKISIKKLKMKSN